MSGIQCKKAIKLRSIRKASIYVQFNTCLNTDNTNNQSSAEQSNRSACH